MVFIYSDISTCLCAVIPTSFSPIFLHLSVFLIQSITGILRWYSIIILITLNGGTGSINLCHSAFSPKPWLLCLVWGSINTDSFEKKNSALLHLGWVPTVQAYFCRNYESSREHVVWMGSLCVKLIHSSITVIGIKDLVRHNMLLEL